MRYGFWTDHDELLEEYPNCGWEFLQNEFCHGGITPYDFLHGHCNLFAEYLHDVYGYDIEAVFEDPDTLIHMYCTTCSVDGRKLYIDVRGITSDFRELMQEYEDEGMCTLAENLADGYLYICQFGDQMPYRFQSNYTAYHKRVLTAARMIDEEFMFYDRTACGLAA